MPCRHGRHIYRKLGHFVGGHWYPFVHLCGGKRTCAVYELLTRRFIQEQQPRPLSKSAELETRSGTA